MENLTQSQKAQFKAYKQTLMDSFGYTEEEATKEALVKVIKNSKLTSKLKYKH